MNNLSNVALWFSRDNEGNTVTIDKVNEEYRGEYICPLCGSEVITKAIDSDYMSAHFAHIDKSKCCGETMVHWWVKNELIKSGDEFIINTNEINKFVCKSIEIEKEYITQNGVYKPDITINTECGKTIFVEINVSNKKNIDQYWDMWRELNNIVVEFNVRDVIEKDNIIKINNNFRAIYYEGKAFIDKETSDYKKYRKSITTSAGEHRDILLKDVEWFLNDIYLYNKGAIDINELEEGFNNICNMDYDYKNLVTSIYKNNKCSMALKDVMKNRYNCMEKIDKKLSEDYKFDDIVYGNNTEERCIIDRLFNKYILSIKKTDIFKYIRKYDKEELENKYFENIGYYLGIEVDEFGIDFYEKVKFDVDKIIKEYINVNKLCIMIEKILKLYKLYYSIEYRSGDIELTESFNRYKTIKISNKGVISINGLNICSADMYDMEAFIEKFEFAISYTMPGGRCLFNQQIVYLYDKLTKVYQRGTFKYYNIDIKSGYIYISFEQENISRFKYENDTTFEEVVDKFSKGIRNYLYVKGDKK